MVLLAVMITDAANFSCNDAASTHMFPQSMRCIRFRQAAVVAGDDSHGPVAVGFA